MNKKIFGIRIGTLLTVFLAVAAAFLVWIMGKTASSQAVCSVVQSWGLGIL